MQIKQCASAELRRCTVVFIVQQRVHFVLIRLCRIKIPNCVALRGKLGLSHVCDREDQSLIVDRIDENDDVTEHKNDCTEQGTSNSYR